MKFIIFIFTFVFTTSSYAQEQLSQYEISFPYIFKQKQDLLKECNSLLDTRVLAQISKNILIYRSFQDRRFFLPSTVASSFALALPVIPLNLRQSTFEVDQSGVTSVRSLDVTSPNSGLRCWFQEDKRSSSLIWRFISVEILIELE